MTDDRFDLVLFGATGYTGGLALAYLAELPPSARGRIAIAGRDRIKLADANRRHARDLGAQLLTADANDPASLEAMAERARVVVNLAGPYTERGPAVVEACVAQGTHYLDLTGEPLFMRDMIGEFHERARERRTRIVHAAGFESLPFDMLTLLAVDALQRRCGVACDQVDVAVRMHVHDPAVLRDAAFSGGTLATILLLLADKRGGEALDPAALLPAGVDPEPIRARHPRSRGARWDPLFESWATPVYPAPTLNPQVILRSAALCQDSGYGPEFRYRESASMDGMVNGPAQRVAASAFAGLIDLLMGVIDHGSDFQRSSVSKLAERFGPKSGQGPRPELLDSFDYSLRARAVGADGQTVNASLYALGNPGYRSTAKMIIQAGLALSQGEGLPERFGVLTPAAALGIAFAERLPAAGMRLRIGEEWS